MRAWHIQNKFPQALLLEAKPDMRMSRKRGMGPTQTNAITATRVLVLGLRLTRTGKESRVWIQGRAQDSVQALA